MIIRGSKTCPETECPECEVCQDRVCPKQDISECTEKIKTETITNYVCPDDTVVEDKDDCKTKEEKTYICEDDREVKDKELCNQIKEIDITSEYQHTAFNTTLAINELKFEMKGDDWGTITSIRYTILNKANHTIIPKLSVFVYNESDSEMRKSDVRGTITVGKTLDENEWIEEEGDVYISFKGSNTSVKLKLQDTIPDPDKTLVLVEKPLELE